MAPLPAFSDSPLLRALLRALLFAAVIEAIFYRLLTIPARSTAWPSLESLHVSTGRAGEMMFLIAFGLLVPAVLGVAYGSLRSPAWPGGLNAPIGIGLLSLVALTILAASGPRGPAFGMIFTGISLAVSLAMLAGMFDAREDAAGRVFAVAMGSALLCFSLTGASEWAHALALRGWPRALDAALTSAGRWLLFLAGALAYPAFTSAEADKPGIGERAATLGVPAASAFALVLGAIVQPAALVRLGGAVGPIGSGISAGIVRAAAGACALFLVTHTSIRGLLRPATRLRAYGLLFLLLAGWPHRVAYEHMLAVLGVALVTATSRPSPIAVLFAADPLPPSTQEGEPPAPNG